MADKIARAASILVTAWRDPGTLEAVPAELHPSTLEEAIAVQDAMVAAIDEPVAGWKVAGRPEAPAGRVMSSTCYKNGATLPQPFFKRCFLESELALKILKDLPPRAEPYTAEDIAEVSVLTLTVELVGSRLNAGKIIPDTEAEKHFIIADNAAQLGMVVGPEVPNWREINALEIPVTATVGGEALPPQPPENRRDPVEVTVWLANHLSARGITLAAGQIVTTGSATVPSPLPPGQEAVIDYGEFGTITLRVAAG